MKTSIAMTSYNGSQHLQQQLSSFLEQDHLPDELIVCDDGSTDNTVEILEQFSLASPFEVRIFCNNKNLGFTKNFEQAISKCAGDIIFLSDQDDKWFPNKISSVINFFEENTSLSLLIHDAQIVDENLKYHGSNTLSQAMSGYGNNDVYITGALSAIKRDLLDYILPFPDSVKGHDGWIHNVGKILNKRAVMNLPLGLIRRHSKNTSSWIASSVKKINFYDVLQAQIQSIDSTSQQKYDDRIEINQSLMIVLKKYRKINDEENLTFVDQKRQYLDREFQALIRRNNLSSQSFIMRKFKAIELLFRGDYFYFNNLKSFIRDMLR
jgi:glycosyltransferase involved in cell wall biosynthesis